MELRCQDRHSLTLPCEAWSKAQGEARDTLRSAPEFSLLELYLALRFCRRRKAGQQIDFLDLSW